MKSYVDQLKEIKPYYFNFEDLEKEYCNSVDCHSCDGYDMNGEPNGYGCSDAEEYAENNSERCLESDDYTLNKDAGVVSFTVFEKLREEYLKLLKHSS